MRTPAVIVEHSTDSPARDFQVAAALMAALMRRTGTAYRFVRVVGENDAALPGETREHVARSGGLVANGWLWIERIGPPPNVSLARHVNDRALAQRQPSVVVSINPRVLDAANLRTWQRELAQRFAAAPWVIVSDEPDRLRADVHRHDDNAETAGFALEFDRYGRLEKFSVDRLVDALIDERTTRQSPPTATPHPFGAPRIAVIGEREYHERVYPAVRASLGDAADALNSAPELRFISAQIATEPELRQALASADGIVLPGGSDLRQVEAQIVAAAIAIDERIPVLGLCLGMQTMLTAFARRIAGIDDADLEETNPQARALTFRRLHQGGVAAHRLGLRRTRLVEGSLLERLYGRRDWEERMNHRFALDRGIAERLVPHGLEIGAVGDDEIADAVAWPKHPFFVGAQGHPEQSSTPERPHPLVAAFLQEVQQR